MDIETVDAEVKEWRISQLRLLGFSYMQRKHLLEMIENGELELAEVRRLVEQGCPVDLAWWIAA